MITYWNLGLALALVVLIAAISSSMGISSMGIREGPSIEPLDIFHG